MNKNTNGNSSDLQSSHKSIEKHMKLAHKLDEKTLKILLLGPGSSGKTTVLKQIKKEHPEFDEEEIEHRRRIATIVQNAVVRFMQILCEQSTILHEKHGENTSVNPKFDDIRQEILQLKTRALQSVLTPEIGCKIRALWSDDGIKETLNKRSYFQIADNVQYFFNKIETISSAHYVPDFDDYVRFRHRTTGFTQTSIMADCAEVGRHSFQFTDVGGQRSERKKWMSFVSEAIDAVIYIVAISDYDLKCYEDYTTNRLVEAINLFRTVMMKGHFFADKSVLIFFNKYDLFEAKIKNVPITVAFDDFPVNEKNANDVNDVIGFVANKFLAVFKEQHIQLTSPLHIIRTTALDTEHIQNILTDVTMDLVQQRLKSINFI